LPSNSNIFEFNIGVSLSSADPVGIVKKYSSTVLSLNDCEHMKLLEEESRYSAPSNTLPAIKGSTPKSTDVVSDPSYLLLSIPIDV